MAHDVFISYSSRDREVAKAICAYLEERRIRCFVDYRDIPGGVNYGAALVQAVESCHLMVLIFSSHSNQSKEIDKELTLAAKYGKPILPFKLVDEPYVQSKEYHLVDRHWIDAFPQAERHFDQLLAAVTTILGPTLKEPPHPKSADSSLEAGPERVMDRDEIPIEPHPTTVRTSPPPLPAPVQSHVATDATRAFEPMGLHEPVAMEPAEPRKRKWVVVAMLATALTALVVVVVQQNPSSSTPGSSEVTTSVATDTTAKEATNSQVRGTMTDTRDGRTYKTVRIGSQVWMAENLNYAGAGACYLGHPDSCAKFGRLYTWSQVMAGSSPSNSIPSGVKGICPAGWHVPSHQEWKVLERFLNESGSTTGTPLMSKHGWLDSENGTDSYGFAALPAGSRIVPEGENPDDSNYDDAGKCANFWTASEESPSHAWSRVFIYGNHDLGRQKDDKTFGYSLRCLQD